MPIPIFSLELQALMGEWVVYSAYSAQAEYYNHMHDENLSTKEFYQNKNFDADIFFESFSVLCDLKIVKLGSSVRQCKYEDIRQTVFENLGSQETPMINHFVMTADSSMFGSSEATVFQIDSGCQPLFQVLEKEGYTRRANDKYYWTENMRPVMERVGYWSAKGYISPEEKFLKRIPRNCRKALDECAARQDIISGTVILRQLPEVRSSHGVKEHHKLDPMLVMRLLYPQVWSEKKEPIVWRFPI